MLSKLKVMLDSKDKNKILKHKLYLIVDEYDNFNNGVLEGDTLVFENVVTKNLTSEDKVFNGTLVMYFIKKY